MAETLTIRTASSTEVVKIAVPGPQGATGAGVPTGGNTGQLLRKKTGSNYDTEWADAGAGQVSSVNGQEGAVVLTAEDVGLGNGSEPTFLSVTLSEGLASAQLMADGISFSGTNAANAVAGWRTTLGLGSAAVENTSAFAAAQHAAEHEPGYTDTIQATAALVTTNVAALNGIYFSDDTSTNGKLNFFRTGTRKNTKLQYNSSTLRWELIRNLTVEAQSGANNSSVPWGQNWSDPRTPATVTSITVVRAPLETMVQKLAETGAAATATTSEDGLMSSSDKTKLNGIAAGAEVNVQSNWTEADSGSDAFILNKPSTFTPTAHAASHASSGSDPVSLQLTQVVAPSGGLGPLGDGETLSDYFSSAGNIVFSNTEDFAAASHTHGNLTNDGKLGSTAGLPVVTTTAGAVTTLALGTANQVLRVNSGASGVEFADPAAAGVTGAASSASDVLGVSGANITGVDANADRIVYWNNTSNKLAYGTPADAGAAAASHTHAASDITSGTIDTARLASGTANSGTFLRGDQTWAAAGGVTTGSVDNAIIRADGTSGSTSQGSDINILDATTSTQNNVAITNEHSGQTNSSLVLGVKGTGAFIVSPARPDGAATGGNARGASAICIQTGARSANTNVASGADSIAIGRNSKATGSQGIAIGTGAYTASGGGVIIGGGGGLDGNDAVAIGAAAYAQTRGTSLGFYAGFSAYAQGVVAIGAQASSGSINAVAIGDSVSGSLRSGFFTRPFNAIYWSGQTTTNAATVLNLDGTATNRFTIAASTALAVDILLVARRATTQDKWLVARRFLGIRRDGSNNTALIGTVQTIGTDQSEGSPTWTFALTADDTNEALQLEVTGATGETVEWRATAFYRVA